MLQLVLPVPPYLPCMVITSHGYMYLDLVPVANGSCGRAWSHELPPALTMRVAMTLRAAIIVLAALPAADGFAPRGVTESLGRGDPRVRGGARRLERRLCGPREDASRSTTAWTVCSAGEGEGGIEAEVERERVEVLRLKSELEALGISAPMTATPTASVVSTKLASPGGYDSGFYDGTLASAGVRCALCTNHSAHLL